MTEPLTSKPLASELRAIAETIDRNGGWHIAAVKVIAAADEIERLQRELEIANDWSLKNQLQQMTAERDRMREVLEWLDRRGGLGLDAHEWIRKALRGADETKADEPCNGFYGVDRCRDCGFSYSDHSS